MLGFKMQQRDLHPFLLLVISLFSLYFITKWLWKKTSTKRFRPSPPKLPILGNLHQLRALTHRSFQYLGSRYGSLMLLYFGSTPVIIVQSADAASDFLKKHDLIFADKPHSRTTRRLFYDMKDISVAPYGEYWRKLKSLCVLQLLSSKMVQSFDFIREEETALLMKKIDSCYSPVNLSELFVLLTNDVICRAAFGRKYSNEEAGTGMKFLMLLREVVQLLGSSIGIGEFIPWLSWINRANGFDSRVDRVAEQVDEFLELVIEERLNGDAVEDESRGSFIGILLNIYKDNSSGIPIDRNSIKAVILDMLAGGTDTTSATLEWAMTELLRHPLVLKKLQKELGEILKGKQDITKEDLGKMQYLKAVVKETLRLHPPITLLARVAREDVTIKGYDVAAGTMVLINTWAIGREPSSWDEPEKFYPERFLKSSVGSGVEFIPFGAGRRGCPGITFGMASIEVVLANIVNRFEWKLTDSKKCEDLDTTEQPGTTIHRKYPLLAVAVKCNL